MLCRAALTSAIVLLVVAAQPQAENLRPRAIGPDKKLIEWGWDEPSPSFMRQHCERMDRVGFDGVIFHAEAASDGETVNFAWECWGARRFEISDLSQAIEDLQACDFERMTDNFLRFNVCPGDVDWFDDDAFGVVVHNAKVAAHVARQGGCKGFMFDVEMYHNPLFSYAEQVRRETKSFADYEAKVRQRGQEFIRAINSEYPDITILLTFGYTITGVGGDRSKARYGLLKNFLDGMFEAAANGTTIVDAYEGAYPFRKHGQFVAAYRTVREDMPRYSAVPDACRRHLKVGFGVWMDMGWRRYGWHTRDFEMNYFTPDELEYSVFCGLDVSDEYVWIYTETPRWWTSTKLPAPYCYAIRKAKWPHVIDDSDVGLRQVKGDKGAPKPRAADQPGYSDEETFGDLEGEYDFIADLPREWKFRTDPKDEGIGEHWFAPDLDLSGWRDMKIGQFWDEQGLEYAGYAWYRLEWEVPAYQAPTGARVVLWFGAADETAAVWVNGVKVGGHDIGPDVGWDKRFPIVVTRALRPGERNTIAVRVHNSTLAGGLWKPIKLAIESP